MKAKQGEVLSLDKYFKFYIFQSQEKNYSPYYPKTNPKIAEYWDDQNFMELSKFTHEVLNMNPFNLDDLYKISVANYMMREMEGFHSLYSVYFGIMQSILASGNGHTYDSAYVVVSTADEYLILNYLELGSKGQSLIYSDGHNYDILNSVDEFENEQEVYFNIDLPFNHLGSSFSDSSPKKKKKKRKNGL